MKPVHLLLSSLVIFQLFLAGCGPAKPVSPAAPATSTPYIISSIPSPKADSATIHGTFMWKSGSTDEVGSSVILSLGKVLKNDQGTPSMAQLDTNTKLRTLTDSVGRFVFTNVPPGTYVLVFDRIADAFMLKDPKTGEDYTFEAKAGETLDLGKLVFDRIP